MTMTESFPKYIHYVPADRSFNYHHALDQRPDPHQYKLHYEKGCELYMVISGAGSYTIEGSRYELEPYSILMMSPNELHVVNISEQSPYERVVLHLSESFLPPFMLNGVDLFRAIKFRKPGQDNQIKADTVRSSGLLELFAKLEQLLSDKNPENEFVAKCVIVQILSTINRIAEADSSRTYQRDQGAQYNKMGAVLEYINSNLEQELSLDSLSETFYLTKYHLCHLFKKTTGYSINQYITFKRIRMADGLMLEGYTPTQACFMSGFNCYSSFFKSYRKLTGKSPKNGKSK